VNGPLDPIGVDPTPEHAVGRSAAPGLGT
jgi:hypothetical protein